MDLRELKQGNTPPLAHKDVFQADDLAQIAAEAQAAPAEIPENTNPLGQPSLVDHLIWPPFIVVVALLLISLVLNLVN